MVEEDYIKEPLKNVFGLNREPNQSYDTENLKFTGYTSFGMNLAETQDNTYSVPNQLARLWQDRIDNGEDLPDLYIIQIAIGSQGLYGMWDPDRPKKLIPGKLGEVDISMYPLAVHVLGLLKKYFTERELEPECVGMHWRGGEQETRMSIAEMQERGIKKTYLRLFAGLREALGYETEIVLHKMPFREVMLKEDPTGEHLKNMEYINSVFEELVAEMDNAKMFDPEKAPFHDPNAWDRNIFRWDLIHYNQRTNTWVAEEILNDYILRSNK
jgi:hypothetical protein